jgi:hypothetical protein
MTAKKGNACKGKGLKRQTTVTKQERPKTRRRQHADVDVDVDVGVVAVAVAVLVAIAIAPVSDADSSDYDPVMQAIADQVFDGVVDGDYHYTTTLERHIADSELRGIA